MGKITSSIGLITGINIQDTVDKLMELQAQPRDQMVKRNEKLEKQQVAVTELTARLVALQFSAKKFAAASLFEQKTATSNNPSLLTATVTGNPVEGRYTYTPVRAATTQQLLSSGFSADDTPLGGGSFSMQYGGEVDKGVNLGMLNGGAGIQRGKIRITDRSGASAEIDLRFANTVDDVLQAINGASGINVTLEARGDRFVLVDHTGQTTSNLRVQQVGTGTTVVDLGLGAIDTASSEVAGRDVLRLYEGIPLHELRDGRGIRANTALPDLMVTFRDGSEPLAIDFLALGKDASKATGTRTAANGNDAQLRFTATKEGADFDGYTITYVNHDGITAGNEVVQYDQQAKTLTFYIDEGATTANHLITALAGHSEAGADFTATAVGTGTGVVDVSDGAYTTGGAARAKGDEITLGDMIATINKQGEGRLRAEMRPDGDGLQIVDLTTDRGGEFTIASAFDSPTLSDLGLTSPAVDGVITGERIVSGLKTTLLGSLNGGRGLDLGTLDITDRSGASVSVDLSTATTLDDVVSTINTAAADAGVAVRVSTNASRMGLKLEDLSDSTSGPLIVANGSDEKNTADQLGLTFSGHRDAIDGGSLRRQTVTHETPLAALNGGGGIAPGQFRITNSAGAGATITVDNKILTVGDLIDSINNRGIDVEARINDAGDGIVLIDKAGGEGSLSVSESGGRTATTLHLLGTAKEVEIQGTTRQIIEGGNRFTIELDDDDTLDDLIEKINGVGGGIAALKLGDGSVGNPYRLSLFGVRAGEQANLLFDTQNVNFSFNETSRGQDALLMFGSPESNGTSVLISSKTNTFSGVLPGVNLQVEGASTTPVSLEIKATDEKLLAAANELVTSFNSLRDKLSELTYYNADSNMVGPLHGSLEALRIETEMSSLITGRFFGAGSIQSLGAIGIGITDTGKLSLDQERLKQAFAADPQAVTEFFTKEEIGVAAKMDKLIEQLAGVGSSLLMTRAATLGTRIDSNNQRIAFLDERLERQRERMLLDFYHMELAIGKIQNNLTALDQLQIIPPLTSAKK